MPETRQRLEALWLTLVRSLLKQAELSRTCCESPANLFRLTNKFGNPVAGRTRGCASKNRLTGDVCLNCFITPLQPSTGKIHTFYRKSLSRASTKRGKIN
jgi:hypothetical protein